MHQKPSRSQRLRQLLADVGAHLFTDQSDTITGGQHLRIHCVDCGTRLPLRDWLAGEPLCLDCYTRRLAALALRIAEIEQRRWPE
jgi:hypothetical protein